MARQVDTVLLDMRDLRHPHVRHGPFMRDMCVSCVRQRTTRTNHIQRRAHAVCVVIHPHVCKITLSVAIFPERDSSAASRW